MNFNFRVYLKMKSYLKFEIFAYNLFNTVWFKGGLILHKYDAIKIYKDEILTDCDFEDVCDNLFYDAALCRRILFRKIYMEEVIEEKDKYLDSVSDFYEYIQNICNRDDWFGCLTVFERLFATCAFVINLCFYSRGNKIVDIIKCGHIFWASYFNEFAEQFYQQGGWSELKSVSQTYTSPLIFLQICLQDPENVLFEVTEAIESYHAQKSILIIEGCKTVSKLWVESRIKNSHTASHNPVVFAGYENCFHAEYILKELKNLCNPCSLEIVQYDEECSGRSIFDSDSFNIPLTPTESPESTPEKNSNLIIFDGTGIVPKRLGVDASHTSSSDLEAELSEFSNNHNYFAYQSGSSELEDIGFDTFEGTSNNCLHEFEQPIDFESVSIISDSGQDQHLCRSMNKLHLNHDTLELEETAISETDLCNNKSDSYLVAQDKQCLALEGSSNAADVLDPTDAMQSLSITECKERNIKNLKKCQFMSRTLFLNNVASCDDKISISEWNEKDLMKNISTPIKQMKSYIGSTAKAGSSCKNKIYMI